MLSSRWLVVVAATVSCSSEVARAQSILLASAQLGETGRIGGTSITFAQYVGWRFETETTLFVNRVGGHMLTTSDPPGDIFAAIVRLANVDEFPQGTPFNPNEIVATTTFRPTFPSSEVLTPLVAELSPGSYALVFGSNLFGATGGGAIHNGPDQPDIAPTNISSYIFWGIPRFNEPPIWRTNLASNMRFLISAQLTPLPGDYSGNGAVDAADFSVYRDNLGASVVLPNDTTPGSVTAADYAVWQANFGAGAASSIAVPEPKTLAILSLLFCLFSSPGFSGSWATRSAV